MQIFLLSTLVRLMDMAWLTCAFYLLLDPSSTLLLKAAGIGSICLKGIDVILEVKKDDTNKYR